MTKRMVQMMLGCAAAVSLTACGANGETGSESGAGSSKVVTLEVLNPKVEISSQFEQMVRAYESENPQVKIHVNTIGGGADDRADLKAKFAAGQGPDIFTNGGYEEAKLWKDYLEDLSDQPWVKNAYDYALEPMKLDGKIYGMPVNLEGYGFIYNKDLFAKAGIETLPKTLTELKMASEKLNAAGITPFAVGYSEQWILGVHLLNIAFAHQEDTDAFIQGLNDGTHTITGNQKFKDLIQLLDLTLKYGNKNPLTTDYNTEVTMFAVGQTAMIQQGNWVQPMLDQLQPGMNVGFLPMPINDDTDNDALAIGVPNNWAVNKKTTDEKKAEAKKFLNWMVDSEQGQKYMTEQFKFIPAFKNIKTDNLGPLASDIIRYSKDNKTLTWNWYKYPDGAGSEFGPAMQAYVGKQFTADQLLEEFQKSWIKASK
ncbi:ABC transporter substrate-binding protein [Paenibacillus beijingensis]|uniref:ABC transporter substrate-binding protein n=1 Tax=Paenibacillus beijingensis TaxID=1126833 RepID=A0A0D5NL74_9BACL|nr:ABC transporter substrate-binding protein [Paenibacillus beijingensis]AJY75890.1 ABC transporter substrate-binding protein [Paenibacillus beijingensis]